MKLIEKKCPKCGATLKFHTKDKEAKCEFCNSEFLIENNEKDDISQKDLANINLTSKIVTTFTIIPFVIGGIITIICIACFIFFFFSIKGQIKNQFDQNNWNDNMNIIDDKLNSNTEVEISITELDDSIKEKLSNYAIKEAKNWQITHDYKLQGNMESIGFYYLKNKNIQNIQIYAVIKSTYSNGKNKITLYSAYKFSGKDIESISYNPSLASDVYKLSTYEVTYGYESLEELYDSIIRDNKSSYKIVATDNLYLK